MNKKDLIQNFTSLFKDSESMFPERDYAELEKWLWSSGFFEDPAAMKYHNNFPGGLAQHVLNFYSVYRSLLDCFETKIKCSEDVFDPFLVAIGHDLNKIGRYSIIDVNRKIDGSWKSLKVYGYKEGDAPCFPGNKISLESSQRLRN